MTNHTTDELKEDPVPILTIDPSALEFYFEAMLPDVGATTRAHMAAAIMRGVTASQNQLLDLVEDGPRNKDNTYDKERFPRSYFSVQASNETNGLWRSHIANVRKGIGQ